MGWAASLWTEVVPLAFNGVSTQPRPLPWSHAPLIPARPAAFAVRSEAVQVGPTRHEVTAILVLYGLPRLLTGCILAHECTHAYL